MPITTIQVLAMLSKVQKLGLNPQITIFEGDFIIEFNDIHGRDWTECITVTKEGVWKGYGWRFEHFMSILDKKIGARND